MKTGARVLTTFFLLVLASALSVCAVRGAQQETHRLYVAVPGIRNELQYGGIGILVYDMDAGFKLIKRIPTWDVPPGQAAENVKGIAASAKTGKLYVSTIKRVACFDLITKRKFGRKRTMAAPTVSPSPQTVKSSTCLPSRGLIGLSSMPARER